MRTAVCRSALLGLKDLGRKVRNAPVTTGGARNAISSTSVILVEQRAGEDEVCDCARLVVVAVFELVVIQLGRYRLVCIHCARYHAQGHTLKSCISARTRNETSMS